MPISGGLLQQKCTKLKTYVHGVVFLTMLLWTIGMSLWSCMAATYFWCSSGKYATMSSTCEG